MNGLENMQKEFDYLRTIESTQVTSLILHAYRSGRDQNNDVSTLEKLFRFKR